MTLFNGRNPLLEKSVLTIDIPELDSFPGEHKVRRLFIPDNRHLISATTDIIGAFDQPHLTETGEPAHYSSKGKIITILALWGKILASKWMPTDYAPRNIFKKIVPLELWDRFTVHILAKIMLPVEFIARSSTEGSLAKNAKEGKFKCGQQLPPGLLLGQLLRWPILTPTTKAPKGQKDKDITLEEYFETIGKIANDSGKIANYLYGMSIILHLSNRAEALKAGLDRPDQKMEFGLFEKGLPIHGTHIQKWDIIETEKIFNRLCHNCGFSRDAWKEMPLFNLGEFCRYATKNATTGHVRLVDETGGTDDGRYRPMNSTLLGRQLIEIGCLEQGKIAIEDYWCKEYFRLESKRTGKGGYDESAGQTVVISGPVLEETGRRNLMVLLTLKEKLGFSPNSW